MNFARFFIDRPIFASVLSILIVTVGLLSLRNLPIAQYPEIVPPTIQVSATYPGAAADTIAETVATPIEQEINGVEKMLYLSSQSANDGSMTITVTFALGTDLDQAQVQVQNRVARAEPRLPEEVRRLGIVTNKRSPDITLVVNLVSPDKSRDQLYLSNFALLNVKDTLARLPGVGETGIFGARDYAMRVWLDPEKIATRGLTASDVVAALREQNVQVAAGTLGQPPAPEDNLRQIPLVAEGRLETAEDFERIVVKTGAAGQVTRLADVARVELSAQSFSMGSYLDGQPSVGIPIYQLPGSNSLETADAVRDAMEELKERFPPGVAYDIVYDTTLFVRESIEKVVHTLFEAVALVFFVVLIFLQNWRATIIPLLAVPVSLIGTFAVMDAFGFSLNNLSLFGLVLAIGIVVDDAIVVVENVERNMALGMSPKDATYKAMKEISGALVAIGLVLSAVFIPTAFVPGISGQFYKQFALTIAVSTLISVLNSLTLSPALCALLLKPHGEKKDWLGRLLDVCFGWLFRGFNWGFEKATSGYARALKSTIRVSVVAVVVYVGLLFLTGYSFKIVPGGFIPEQDKGYVIAVVQLPPGASLQRTERVVKQAEEIAMGVPGVGNLISLPGLDLLGGGNSPNAGIIFIPLAPFDERTEPEESSDAVIAQLGERLAALPEGMAFVIAPPPVSGMGSTGGFRMILQDRGGGSPAELQTASQRFIAAAGEHPAIGRAFTTFRADNPQIFLDINREQANSMDVPLSNVFDTLQIYLGSLYVNDFTLLNRNYRVIAQAESEFRQNAEDLMTFRTRNAAGEMVPLATLLEARDTIGPDRLLRYNLYPSVEISGDNAPGVSTGEGLAALEQIAEETLPASMGYEWTGLSFQEKIAGSTALFTFPLCVLFVFLVLAAQYESWSLPLAIILIVPMCLLSALGGLWFRGMDNNIFTQIGFIVLVGLACKNAILIVEFARQLRREGKSRAEAAVDAARLRLRPILMTSFAFTLGVVPLALASGAGSEMRVALGTAVVFGMLGVTFFGLFFTPVFYVVVEWFVDRRKARKESA